MIYNFYIKSNDTSSRAIEITISTGMTARDAARVMQLAGCVKSAEKLIDAMTKLGIDRRLRPGVYNIIKGNPDYVAEQLKTKVPLSAKFTIIPGTYNYDLTNIISELSDDALFPPEIQNHIMSVSPVARTMFLLPDTYSVVPGEAEARQVIRQAAAAWYKAFGDNISNRKDISKLGTLASVIEREAKIDKERPVIAGVFINRLKSDMPLQSCATVIYSWGLRGVEKRKLTYKDLEIDSPYNTYKNKGLPPGPICIPSHASWEAAFNPDQTKYLYFFADKNGQHIFSTSYTEHKAKQN